MSELSINLKGSADFHNPSDKPEAIHGYVSYETQTLIQNCFSDRYLLKSENAVLRSAISDHKAASTCFKMAAEGFRKENAELRAILEECRKIIPLLAQEGDVGYSRGCPDGYLELLAKLKLSRPKGIE